MKDKIMTTLTNYPNGARLRELASDLHTHTLLLWNPIAELQEEGKITETSVVSYATGENYYLFKINKEITR